MNKPIVNKGDRITLPRTPGTARVNPSMWPTGYRARYGDRSRFWLPAGAEVTVVQVAGPYRDGDPVEVLVRHLPSKCMVLLTIDDLGHECYECGVLGALNDHQDDPDGGVLWLCDECHEAAVIAEEDALNQERQYEEFERMYDEVREDHEAIFDAWWQEQKENRS